MKVCDKPIGWFLITSILFCILSRFALEVINSFKLKLHSCLAFDQIISWLFYFNQVLMDSEFPDKSCFRDCEYYVQFTGGGNHKKFTCALLKGFNFSFIHHE